MWCDISLWFYFVLPWQLLVVSTYPCTCWPFVCLLWQNIISVLLQSSVYFTGFLIPSCISPTYTVVSTGYCMEHHNIPAFKSSPLGVWAVGKTMRHEQMHHLIKMRTEYGWVVALEGLWADLGHYCSSGWCCPVNPGEQLNEETLWILIGRNELDWTFSFWSKEEQAWTKWFCHGIYCDILLKPSGSMQGVSTSMAWQPFMFQSYSHIGVLYPLLHWKLGSNLLLFILIN